MDKTIEKYMVINKSVDFLRIIPAYFFVGIIAVLPFIIAFVGGYIESKIKGHPVNEGNSAIFSVFWLALFTIPGAFVVLALVTIAYFKSVFRYFSNRTNEI